MHKLQKLLAALPLAVSASLIVTMPVYAAQHGSDVQAAVNVSANGSTSTTSEHTTTRPLATDDFSHNGSGTSATSDTEPVHRGVASDDAKQQIKQGSVQLLTDLRKEHKAVKTDAERKKACEERKTGATIRIASIGKNTQAFQTKIDAILAKAQAYQVDNNLTVTNYNGLLAAAQAAQTASANSIATLTALTPAIDCNQTNNADNVAAFKVAATKARDNLKTYKTAVKELLKALQAAKPTSEGSSN